MNKVKKVWQENKVLLVLAVILVICLVVFASVSLTYFYGSGNDPYGNRLDATKKVPLNDQLFTDIKEELTKREEVEKVTTNLKGKIVYIDIDFTPGIKVEDAKTIASSTLPLFNEDELSVYDLQYTINCAGNEESAGYTLMGARNSNGSGIIVWNNYNEGSE